MWYTYGCNYCIVINRDTFSIVKILYLYVSCFCYFVKSRIKNGMEKKKEKRRKKETTNPAQIFNYFSESCDDNKNP